MRTEMLIRMEAGSSEKGHHAASKAMKVAAAMEGVESVTLSGKDKNLLRVVGDGVDCNHLTTRLRRKVGHADLVELRTLHGYYGSYGGGGSRTGGGSSSLSSAYGNSGGGSSGYYGGGGGYTYPTTTTATAVGPEYYYGQQQQPSFGQYGYQPSPAPYAAPSAVHYEYYYPSSANDPNSCSIM